MYQISKTAEETAQANLDKIWRVLQNHPSGINQKEVCQLARCGVDTARKHLVALKQQGKAHVVRNGQSYIWFPVFPGEKDAQTSPAHNGADVSPAG